MMLLFIIIIYMYMKLFVLCGLYNYMYYTSLGNTCISKILSLYEETAKLKIDRNN